MKKIFTILTICTFPFFSFAQTSFDWAKSMGGISDDDGYSITVDSLNNSYITGSFRGTADFDPSPSISNITSVGNKDVYIAKYDSLGGLVWVKQFGGSDDDIPSEIQVDKSGNIYCIGQFRQIADFDPSPNTANLTALGEDDIFILKLDNSGNFIWVKHIGGVEEDGGTSITINTQDELLITGYFRGSTDLDPGVNINQHISSGKRDIFILNLDNSGNLNWVKQIGGPEEDWGLTIRTDHNDNIYVSGSFDDTVDFDPDIGISTLTSTGIFGGFALKLNGLGNFQWAYPIVGSGIGIENATQLCTDLQSNVYITGAFNSPTVDFDPSANVANLTRIASFDIFVCKLDSNGNFKWVKQLGGLGYDISSAIISDENANIYVSGSFDATLDFDPSTTTTHNLTPLGGSDIFVCKLDSNGTFVWAEQLGGTGIEKVFKSNLFRNSYGTIYTIGSFEGTVDFDQTAGVLNLTAPIGGTDIFVHKMTEEPVTPIGVKQTIASNFKLYPNPTQGQLKLLMDKQYAEVEINILSVTGQLISRNNYKNEQTIILNIESSTGLYFVEVKTAKGTQALFKVLKR